MDSPVAEADYGFKELGKQCMCAITHPSEQLEKLHEMLNGDSITAVLAAYAHKLDASCEDDIVANIDPSEEDEHRPVMQGVMNFFYDNVSPALASVHLIKAEQANIPMEESDSAQQQAIVMAKKLQYFSNMGSGLFIQGNYQEAVVVGQIALYYQSVAYAWLKGQGAVEYAQTPPDPLS